VKKQFFLERGSIQNNEMMSDNGKEDSSGKGGTRRKKRAPRVLIFNGCSSKKKGKTNGEKPQKRWGVEKKGPKPKKPQLIWTEKRTG